MRGYETLIRFAYLLGMRLLIPCARPTVVGYEAPLIHCLNQ